MTNFAIVDCGVGNLRSVQKVFERLGATATITNDANDLLSSDGIVLPGVGAFGDAMGKLESDGVANVIRHEAGERGKPLLGICLGMQLLGRSSAPKAVLATRNSLQRRKPGHGRSRFGAGGYGAARRCRQEGLDGPEIDPAPYRLERRDAA